MSIMSTIGVDGPFKTVRLQWQITVPPSFVGNVREGVVEVLDNATMRWVCVPRRVVFVFV